MEKFSGDMLSSVKDWGVFNFVCACILSALFILYGFFQKGQGMFIAIGIGVLIEGWFVLSITKSLSNTERMTFYLTQCVSKDEVKK